MLQIANPITLIFTFLNTWTFKIQPTPNREKITETKNPENCAILLPEPICQRKHNESINSIQSKCKKSNFGFKTTRKKFETADLSSTLQRTKKSKQKKKTNTEPWIGRRGGWGAKRKKTRPFLQQPTLRCENLTKRNARGFYIPLYIYIDIERERLERNEQQNPRKMRRGFGFWGEEVANFLNMLKEMEEAEFIRLVLKLRKIQQNDAVSPVAVAVYFSLGQANHNGAHPQGP